MSAGDEPKNVTMSTEDSGNTKESSKRKKQVNPSKRWVFTLNNYTREMSAIVREKLGSDGFYIFGREVGELGTPHLQGYVEFHRRVRPMKICLEGLIHWEKAKGSKQENIEYCTKDGDWETNQGSWRPREKIYDFLDDHEPLPWQKGILKALKKPVNRRKIFWIYETEGEVGKSILVKHILLKYAGDAVLAGGRAVDLKFMISKMDPKPRIVLQDIPRSTEEDISYAGMEEVKNGAFFNAKYESNMCLLNSPHYFVFANFRPSLKEMSADRWAIYRIENNRLKFEPVIDNDIDVLSPLCEHTLEDVIGPGSG